MFLSCFSLMYAPITIATKASDRLWPDLGVILEDGGKGTDLRGFGGFRVLGSMGSLVRFF